MIPQRNISLLSNRLAREGGRRIPEEVLERDYCLAWFLVGLSSSPICKSLIFKGGTALKRCYFSKYRFSEDLDFTLAEEMPLETILACFVDKASRFIQTDFSVCQSYLRQVLHYHRKKSEWHLTFGHNCPIVIHMKGNEFIKRIRKYGKQHNMYVCMYVQWMAERGKGSHGTLGLGKK